MCGRSKISKINDFPNLYTINKKQYSDRKNGFKQNDVRKEYVMAEKKVKQNPEEMRCATCGIRQAAEANPNSIMARVWKWHTGWCPGWNAYQNALAGAEAVEVRAMPKHVN